VNLIISEENQSKSKKKSRRLMDKKNILLSKIEKFCAVEKNPNYPIFKLYESDRLFGKKYKG
jgi:hypothetical protein